MYKVDLHTHSVASRDGAITANQYKHIITSGRLDYIAVTDHNKIHFAEELQKELGNHIIVGEEIDTTDGELIGLFLSKKVPPNMSAKKTVTNIKSQGGLVYIPHPFETVRKGVSQETLKSIIDEVDIIEVYNGRAVFQNMGPQALTAARLAQKAGAASSDAHGAKGLATAYSLIGQEPTSKSLVALLLKGQLETRRPPLHTLLYPKLNRLKKGWSRD
jgi:predicted metal-dependent phosphoesterase TrpH